MRTYRVHLGSYFHQVRTVYILFPLIGLVLFELLHHVQQQRASSVHRSLDNVFTPGKCVQHVERFALGRVNTDVGTLFLLLLITIPLRVERNPAGQQ
uniref:Putative secreted protein n=1 Tax=Anopheles darlingi TaxID=43151 RepID=A0A2M4DL72_ANODA